MYVVHYSHTLHSSVIHTYIHTYIGLHTYNIHTSYIHHVHSTIEQRLLAVSQDRLAVECVESQTWLSLCRALLRIVWGVPVSPGAAHDRL
jgi:hypothetical protein